MGIGSGGVDTIAAFSESGEDAVAADFCLLRVRRSEGMANPAVAAIDKIDGVVTPPGAVVVPQMVVGVGSGDTDRETFGNFVGGHGLMDQGNGGPRKWGWGMILPVGFRASRWTTAAWELARITQAGRENNISFAESSGMIQVRCAWIRAVLSGGSITGCGVSERCGRCLVWRRGDLLGPLDGKSWILFKCVRKIMS